MPPSRIWVGDCDVNQQEAFGFEYDMTYGTAGDRALQHTNVLERVLNQKFVQTASWVTEAYRHPSSSMSCLAKHTIIFFTPFFM